MKGTVLILGVILAASAFAQERAATSTPPEQARSGRSFEASTERPPPVAKLQPAPSAGAQESRRFLVQPCGMLDTANEHVALFVKYTEPYASRAQSVALRQDETQRTAIVSPIR